MIADKEYQLIRNFKGPQPAGKLEWAIKIAFSLVAAGYFLHGIINNNLPWLPVVIVLVFIFFSLFVVSRLNRKPYNFIRIQDNKLYITTNNATLWCKPVEEITSIELEEPRKMWKIQLGSRMLIFRTHNDSYSLDFQNSTFAGIPEKEAINELKQLCRVQS